MRGAGRLADTIVSIAIMLAVVGVAAFGLFTVLRLTQTSGTTYKAELQDAQRLEVANPIRIGGAERGAIEKIDLTDDGHAMVTFRLDKGVPIYRDARLALRSRGLDSDRYLDLQQGTDGAGALPANSQLPMSQTSTPLDLEGLTTAVTPEIKQTIEPFLAEANATLGGKEQALGQLITNLNGFTTALADGLDGQEPKVKQAVDNSAYVLGALAKKQADLKRLISSSDQFFGSLADNNAQIANLIDSSDVFISTLAQKNQQLAQLIDSSDSFFGAVSARNGQLNQLISFADQTLASLGQDTDSLLRTVRQSADFNRTVLAARDDFSLFIKLAPQDLQLWSDIFRPTSGKKSGLMGIYTTDPITFAPLPVKKTGERPGG